MANINMANINDVMQPYTNSYNKAQDNYLNLRNAASRRWKEDIKSNNEDFDAITNALATFVAKAETMKDKAHEYLESDITLLRESQANYENDANISVIDDGSIIEATGRAFDKYSTSRSMMLYYTRSMEESREYYNIALDCYISALAEQTWWSNLVPTLKEENKSKKSYRPGAVFDAISALGDARGRINKTTLRKRKHKKRKHKNRTVRR